MDSKLMREIDAFVEDSREKIVRDIARLVAVSSVEGEPGPGAPFGAGPRQVLDEALSLARDFGLEAVDCDGYIGYAGLGRGDKYLATITHLDTVPAGEGWTGDPFVLREREGWIIGRGVMDDKGPSVLCLYALKFLKEAGIPLRYPIRALLGVNEETNMNDVHYYLAHEKAPLFCFSPDADFPLCSGEKGICHGRIVSNAPAEQIVSWSGAEAANAIPGAARALVRADKLSSTDAVSASPAGDGLWALEAKGIGGHASRPEGTVNALGLLVDYLLENKVGSPAERDFLALLALLHRDSSGALLGVAAEDEIFTPLTIVGTQVSVEDGRLCQVFDSRYPTTMSGEKLGALIAEKAGALAQVSIDADKAPFYVSLDDPALQACLAAYREVTGETDAQAYTIGGGTYSRLFPKAVAFGPEHHDRPLPEFGGPIHGADEAASMDFFMEALRVYITALISLEELDLG